MHGHGHAATSSQPDGNPELRTADYISTNLHNVSDDYRKVVQELMGSALHALESDSTFETADTERFPWKHFYDQVEDQLVVLTPARITTNHQPMTALVFSLIEKLGSKVRLTPCYQPFGEPTYDLPVQAVLRGIRSYILGTKPQFVAHDSQPATKYCVGLWLKAARDWSQKTKSRTANYVLPSTIRGEEASSVVKYIRSMLLSANGDSQWAATVSLLLTLLSHEANNRFDAIGEAVHAMKVPWREVFTRGIPHDEHKVKPRGQKKAVTSWIPRPIPSPATSLWLATDEKSVVSSIYKEFVLDLGSWKKGYESISPEMSHRYFDEHVAQLKQAWNTSSNASTIFMNKLGRRKAVILASDHVKGLPKKKIEENPFLQTNEYFSKATQDRDKVQYPDLAAFSPLPVACRLWAGGYLVAESFKKGGPVDFLKADWRLDWAPADLKNWLSVYHKYFPRASHSAMPAESSSAGIDSSIITCPWG
jgi:hypothetical protein